MGCGSSKMDDEAAPTRLTPAGGDPLNMFLLHSLRNQPQLQKPYTLPHLRDVKSWPDVYLCASTAGELASLLRQSFPQHVGSDAADDNAFCKAMQAMGRAVTSQPSGYICLPFSVFPALKTTADVCVVSEISAIARKLTRDEYGADGHSRIVIGPQGSGKTVALQRFALVAPVLLPSLRVVYISMKGIHSGAHPVHAGLTKFLFTLGLRSDKGRVECPAGEDTTFAVFVDCLNAAELHLMVIFDDMEILYQSSGDHAYQLIAEVNQFVSSSCGRVSFIGCSSSFCMYPLVKMGVDIPTALHSTFLAVRDAGKKGVALPDMNATKLRLLCIPAIAPPTSIAIDANFFKDGVTPHQKRVVIFLSGANVRLLCNRRLPNPCCAPMLALQGVFDADTSALCTPLVSANQLIADMCAAMYTTWYEQNAKLLATIVTNGNNDVLERIHLDAIGQVDWEREFIPIRGVQELYASLQRLISFDQLQSKDYRDALAFLENDAALIVKFRNASTKVDEWYPASLLALLLHDYEAACHILQLKTADVIVADTLPQWIIKQVITSKTYDNVGKLVKDALAARARAAVSELDDNK